MVVKFLVDCGLKDANLDPGHLSLAFEYAYEPLLRFWRDFDLTGVVQAISERFPNWRSAVQNAEQTGEDVLCEVEAIVFCHALDEANAEMLMALPPQARPKGRAATSEWIFAELQKRGLAIELIFARRDGYTCGEVALEVVRCLENAAVGLEYERLGTKVARLLRRRNLDAQKSAQHLALRSDL